MSNEQDKLLTDGRIKILAAEVVSVPATRDEQHAMAVEIQQLRASPASADVPALVKKLRRLREVERVANLIYGLTVAEHGHNSGKEPEWLEPLRLAITASDQDAEPDVLPIMCEGGCGLGAFRDHRGEYSATCGALRCVEKVQAGVLASAEPPVDSATLNPVEWRPGVGLVSAEAQPIPSWFVPISTEKTWTIKLNSYHRANLLWLFEMIGYPFWKSLSVEPFTFANTGDWVGEIPLMLDMENDREGQPNVSRESVVQRIAAWRTSLEKGGPDGSR